MWATTFDVFGYFIIGLVVGFLIGCFISNYLNDKMNL